MSLLCIDPGTNHHITRGKVYNVVDYEIDVSGGEEYVKIINNIDDEGIYRKERFFEIPKNTIFVNL